MSSNSDSQNISGIPSAMTDSDFNSDSTSSSPVVSVNSPVVDNARELRTKSHNDCSTLSQNNEELTLRASPIGSIVALGNALGVPVYDQYGTIVGLAEHSPQLFPLGEASSSRPVGRATEGEAIARPSRCPREVSSVDSDELKVSCVPSCLMGSPSL